MILYVSITLVCMLGTGLALRALFLRDRREYKKGGGNASTIMFDFNSYYGDREPYINNDAHIGAACVVISMLVWPVMIILWALVFSWVIYGNDVLECIDRMLGEPKEDSSE